MLQSVYLLKPNEYSGNNSYMDSSRRRALDKVMSATACQQLVCHLAELMLMMKNLQQLRYVQEEEHILRV